LFYPVVETQLLRIDHLFLLLLTTPENAGIYVIVVVACPPSARRICMVMVNEGGLTRMSLAEAIKAKLRERILSGEIAMGERITEQNVAKAMGTSAGPVREAFAGLVHEGLVVSPPNRGTYVTNVSQQDAREANAVRQRLEPLAFELLRTTIDSSTTSELQRIVDELVRQGERADRSAIIKLCMRFHEVFFSQSENSILATIWPMIEGTLRKFLAAPASEVNPDPKAVAASLARAWSAFQAGDMAAVNDALGSYDEAFWPVSGQPA
jgi:DNA-binding GntR family transcriptional regulator